MTTAHGWIGAAMVLAVSLPAVAAEPGPSRAGPGVAASQPTSRAVADAPARNDASVPVDARDEAIFGGEPDDPVPAAAGEATESRAQPQADRDTQMLGRPDQGAESVAADPAAKLEGRLLDLGTDRLQIGGLMLLRLNMNFTDGGSIEDQRISLPNLVDVYLDARPTDRIRAFVRGRLLWDPTVSDDNTLDQLSQARVTEVQLNELWLAFDIARFMFVTLGQKRVLTGTTRFWNPIDVINEQRRPVFNLFDQRNGVPMVKLHVPVESLGWNFYAIGVMDEVDSLNKAGVFGRAEFVVSTVEFGLIGAYRESFFPVVGADISAGIWNFDLAGEMTLKFDEQFDNNVSLRTTAGLAYNIAVFDEDMLIIGTEYFYNQQGSADTDVLGLLTGTAQFFYTGRHYGAVYATLPGPARLDDWTFTVSSVGNFSDHSFIARFDVSVRLLTYLNLQMFVIGHFGNHGELRLGADALTEEEKRIAEEILEVDDINEVFPAQVVDIGFWLSLDL